MKKSYKLPIYLVLALFFLMIAVLGGCTTAKKPAPEPTAPSPQVMPTPQTPAPLPAPAKNMPTNTTELNRISKTLADEAARVPGVKSASVVISGNTAYVGVDISAQAEKGKTDRIKSDVAKVVKSKENRLTNVLVSTDADTTTRLKKIADGLAKGQPMTAFNREMAEIARRMSPNVR